MAAYLTRMPSGIPGVINRAHLATVQPEILDSVNGPTAYGTFCKYTTGKLCKIAGGEAPADIVGLIARPYPVSPSTANEALGVATPDLTRPGDLMKRGYMTVKMGANAGAVVKGGKVYLVINAAGGNTVGDIMDADDGANNIEVADCFFMGPADGSGNVEIEYKL